MMKQILLIIALLAGSAIVWGKPARRTPMRVVQPDGFSLTIIKRGDERCHNTFTTDGYPVVKLADSGYCYATAGEGDELEPSTVSAHDEQYRGEKEKLFLAGLDMEAIDVALIEKAKRQRESGRYEIKCGRGISDLDDRMATRGQGRCSYSFPVQGKQKALVILAEFADVKFNSKNGPLYSNVDPYTYFYEMLNKEGFSTYFATGSARDWFLDNSNGIFEPQFDVFGPVTLPHDMKYYGENDRYGEDKRPHQMIIDACVALDSVIDYREYDRDGDGYVDNVYLFYAGYGEADSDEEDSVWPHSWAISSAMATDNPMDRKPLELDGVYIEHYACSNETMGYTDSYYKQNRPDGIGTFVHEFSHVLGLPDLYSTAYATSYREEPFTPGEFSVLDFGPYNNSGLTPPNYSAYERYALDWLVPEEIVSGDLTLENIADSNHAYIIKTDVEREFFLLENRQLDGWDKYIPAAGMLVWHIDYLPVKFYDNEVNNTKNHQYVDLVEADDIQDYPIGEDRWGYFIYGESTLSGDPFPGSKGVKSFGYSTAPSLRSWSGANLGVEISDISMSAKKISFHSSVDGSEVKETADMTGIDNGVIYNLSGSAVGEIHNGELPHLERGVYILHSGNYSKKIVIGL